MVDLRCGDCIEKMRKMEDGSVDLILTDPPYELGFMGKKWDKSGIAFSVELWEEALRILKPGGYLMAFSGTRTYHNMAYAIEQAGFNVKDMIAYTYGSGFPKALDISKAIDKKLGKEREVVGQAKSGKTSRAYQSEEETTSGEYNLTAPASDIAKLYEGYKTALKPAIEPIVIAQKPLEGTYAENVMKYGTGGLNIEDCRIETTENLGRFNKSNGNKNSNFQGSIGNGNSLYARLPVELQGRYPANFIISEDIAPILDEQSGIRKSGAMKGVYKNTIYTNNRGVRDGKEIYLNQEASEGGASRFFYNTKLDEEDYIPFFYTSKASKKERNSDVNGNLISGEAKQKIFNGQSGKSSTDMKDVEKRFTTLPTVNNHPTLKPISIMKYLATLGLPPRDSVVLDMFAGSGTTGLAIEKINKETGSNHKCILIEKEEEYCEIIRKRLGVPKKGTERGNYV